MNSTRRAALKGIGAMGAMVAAAASGMLASGRAFAARNAGAFEAKSVVDAMRALGMANAENSKAIEISAPDIAENGAVVPVDITSNIPGTTNITVLIERNQFPYVAGFDIPEGTVPYVHLRVKMGESSPVRVVATAGGKHYTATKEVKVTIGGCGG